MMSTDTPKVWIGCLASYNAGRLIGEWVDATDADELEESKNAILARTGGEEWFIADTDGFPSGTVGEYSSFERVARLGALIEEHGEAARAYLAWAEPSEIEGEDVEDHFTRSYRGEWDSEKDYCYNLADELDIFGGLPDDHTAVMYFDWDYWARDMFRHGPYTFVQPEGHYGSGFVFESDC